MYKKCVNTEVQCSEKKPVTIFYLSNIYVFHDCHMQWSFHEAQVRNCRDGEPAGF